jgi:hypothetical protein
VDSFTAEATVEKIGNALLGHRDRRREAWRYESQDQLTVCLEAKPRAAVIRRDVCRAGPPRQRPPQDMRALIVADDHVRPPTIEVKHLACGSQIESGSHGRTCGRNAPRTDLLEELALVVQRDEPRREAALRERR